MRLTGLQHSLLWLFTGANIAAGRQAISSMGMSPTGGFLRRGEGGGPKARKGEGAAGDAAGAAPADLSLQGSASLALEKRIELMDSMMQSMRVMDSLLVDIGSVHYQQFHPPSLNFVSQAFFTP